VPAAHRKLPPLLDDHVVLIGDLFAKVGVCCRFLFVRGLLVGVRSPSVVALLRGLRLLLAVLGVPLMDLTVVIDDKVRRRADAQNDVPGAGGAVGERRSGRNEECQRTGECGRGRESFQIHCGKVPSLTL